MQNVIIAFAKTEDTENFKKILSRRGISVSMTCNSGAQALFAMEELGNGILICGYRLTDMLYTELAESLPGHFRMLLIASAGKVQEELPERVLHLTTPLRAGDLFDALDRLGSRVEIRTGKARKPIRQRTPEEERILSRAKTVLMERHRMTEEDAHRYLQKRSMEAGRSIVETAQMVLMLHEGR